MFDAAKSFNLNESRQIWKNFKSLFEFQLNCIIPVWDLDLYANPFKSSRFPSIMDFKGSNIRIGKFQLNYF